MPGMLEAGYSSCDSLSSSYCFPCSMYDKVKSLVLHWLVPNWTAPHWLVSFGLWWLQREGVAAEAFACSAVWSTTTGGMKPTHLSSSAIFCFSSPTENRSGWKYDIHAVHIYTCIICSHRYCAQFAYHDKQPQFWNHLQSQHEAAEMVKQNRLNSFL